MEMIKPNKQENRADFINRSMANELMNDKYSDNRERLVASAKQWANREKQMDSNETMYKTAYIQKGSLNVEERTIIGYASTSMVDRHNEVILKDSWDLQNYQKHPIIFVNHNHQDLWVGKAIWVKADNKGLLFKMKFATSEKAEEVFQLIEDTEIAAFSVGARTYGRKEMTFGELPKRIQSNSRAMGDETPITVHTNVELLEISVVGLPANAGSVISNEMVMYNNLLKDIGDIETDILKVEEEEDKEQEYLQKIVGLELKVSELEQEIQESVDPDIELELDKPVDIELENVELNKEIEITLEDIQLAVNKSMEKVDTSIDIDIDKIVSDSQKRLLGKIN